MVYKTKTNNNIKNNSTDRKIQRQMWKNNLIGIISTILFIIALLDVGGIISKLMMILTP